MGPHACHAQVKLNQLATMSCSQKSAVADVGGPPSPQKDRWILNESEIRKLDK